MYQIKFNSSVDTEVQHKAYVILRFQRRFSKVSKFITLLKLLWQVLENKITIISEQIMQNG